MSETAFTDPQLDPLDNEYRSVEPWAVGGLLLGLASVVALWGGVTVLVAATGVLANLVALARIRHDATRSGRAASMIGLALSTAFLVAPGAQSAASYWLLARQARPVADQWFDDLAHDHPERAVRLGFAPDARPPLDDGIWLYFRHDDEAKALLIRFVRDPLVRTLIALGDRATVRLYEVRSAVGEGQLGGVHYLYTVTYPDSEGHKQTFFVSMLMERKPTHKPGVNPWRVKAYFVGREPPKG